MRFYFLNSMKSFLFLYFLLIDNFLELIISCYVSLSLSIFNKRIKPRSLNLHRLKPKQTLNHPLVLKPLLQAQLTKLILATNNYSYLPFPLDQKHKMRITQLKILNFSFHFHLLELHDIHFLLKTQLEVFVPA